MAVFEQAIPALRGGLPRRQQRQPSGQNTGSGGGDSRRLAKGIGWFSVGLGLAGLVAPRRMARCIGAPESRKTSAVVRLVGLREIASGMGILMRPRPAGWLWARVGGDVMDLALLGSAMRSRSAAKSRLIAAGATVAGITALDYLSGKRVKGGTEDRETERIRIHRAITINRSAEDIYGFWRDFQNLPRVMKHLESVEWTTENRSHWKAAGPAKTTFEWDAEITEDRPNDRIAWRSLEGSDIDHRGMVRFQPAPGGRGTEVHVYLHYDPPAGSVGVSAAKLFGREPGQQIAEDLRRLKQTLETGEVVTAENHKEGKGRR
jgi:uncharacterized membrane protein